MKTKYYRSLVLAGAIVGLLIPTAMARATARKKVAASSNKADTQATATAEGANKPATPSVNARQRKEAARIKAGVKDESLTSKEAKKLIREQKKIQADKAEAKSDGTVTAEERAKLQHEENAASRHIFQERHDAEGEMGPKPRNWKVWDPGVNQRQRNQSRRIAQGIVRGSLTQDEAKSLIEQEAAIAGTEAELKGDGKLTVAERKQLQTLLNETSKLIYAEKHDGEKQPALNKVLIRKIKSGDLTGDEAKELCAQMRRVRELKRLLGGNNPLTDEQRLQFMEELNSLVNNLHE